MNVDATPPTKCDKVFALITSENFLLKPKLSMMLNADDPDKTLGAAVILRLISRYPEKGLRDLVNWAVHPNSGSGFLYQYDSEKPLSGQTVKPVPDSVKNCVEDTVENASRPAKEIGDTERGTHMTRRRLFNAAGGGLLWGMASAAFSNNEKPDVKTRNTVIGAAAGAAAHSMIPPDLTMSDAEKAELEAKIQAAEVNAIKDSGITDERTLKAAFSVLQHLYEKEVERSR